MANITPKSNGTYLIRISCGSDAAGKPVSKSKIFKPSKPNLSYQQLNKEIDAFVKAFEEEIELYGIQERPDRIRFAEFCEKYLEVIIVRPSNDNFSTSLENDFYWIPWFFACDGKTP